jgi:hypothetical protein
MAAITAIIPFMNTNMPLSLGQDINDHGDGSGDILNYDYSRTPHSERVSVVFNALSREVLLKKGSKEGGNGWVYIPVGLAEAGMKMGQGWIQRTAGYCK